MFDLEKLISLRKEKNPPKEEKILPEPIIDYPMEINDCVCIPSKTSFEMTPEEKRVFLKRQTDEEYFKRWKNYNEMTRAHNGISAIRDAIFSNVVKSMPQALDTEIEDRKYGIRLSDMEPVVLTSGEDPSSQPLHGLNSIPYYSLQDYNNIMELYNLAADYTGGLLTQQQAATIATNYIYARDNAMLNTLANIEPDLIAFILKGLNCEKLEPEAKE